jgi:retinol dehydrogenase 12
MIFRNSDSSYIPSLESKVIIITGAIVGLHRQSTLDLTKHNPSQIWIASRNIQTGNATASEIKEIAPKVSIHFLELDLSSSDSIKHADRTFLAAISRLDILILNAGILDSLPAVTSERYKCDLG